MSSTTTNGHDVLVPLSERINNLCFRIQTTSNELLKVGLQNTLLESLASDLAEEAQSLPRPLTGRRCCVVCKMPRLDLDVTGLTCGNVNCLNRLHEFFPDDLDDYEDWQEEKVNMEPLCERIADGLGLQNVKDELAQNSPDFEMILKMICEEVDRVEQKVTGITS